jgi:hypothetical protein
VTSNVTRSLAASVAAEGGGAEAERLRRQLRALAAHNEQLRAQLEAATAELARRGPSSPKAAARSTSKALAEEVFSRTRRNPEAARLERKFRRLVKRKGGVKPALVHVARRLPAKAAAKGKARVGAS